MKKTLIISGFIVYSFAVKAQTISSLTDLKGLTQKKFTSGSGKEYTVKWKDKNDRFKKDSAHLPPPDPLEHGHTPVCSSVKKGGSNSQYNNSKYFDGRARCEAKISPAATTADAISIADLSKKFKDFITDGTFDNMTSDDVRTTNEEHNYTLTNVRIYAIKREEDEDFHMIVGPADVQNQGDLINVEISGLPKSTAPGFKTIKKVRKQFSDELTGIEKIAGSKWSNYIFFPDGIPVKITGSLFYDVDHRSEKVGPSGVQPPTCMELHPVTDIQFDEH
jgi:hypothetical protein